jgi:K+-transporting ATPase ATPase B chain
VSAAQLAEAAQLSLADETPEGRSVVAGQERHGLPERSADFPGEFVPHRQTRMSGVDLQARKACAACARGRRCRAPACRGAGRQLPAPVQLSVDNVSRKGSTPLVVADGAKVLGVIELKDIVKPGMRERFAELRRMGIKTVMVTGDNPLTAAAIAAEAGVDDLAEARPKTSCS